MKKINLFLMAVVFLAACNSGSENNELATLDKKAMEVHDIAMEYYGPLQVGEEAFSQLLSDAKEDSTVLKGHSMQEVEGVLEQLERNYQAMNNWMSSSKRLKDLEELDDDRKKKYLESSLQSITKINDDTKNAIDAAKELAGALGMNIFGEDDHDH